MTKYTPAADRWKIGHHGFPQTLCIVGHLNGQPFTLAQLGEFPNAEESARLMTAAPDLLAALEHMIFAWVPEDKQAPAFTRSNRAAVYQAKAAIAKATSSQE